MLHHYVSDDNSGDHWGVSTSGNPEQAPKVLVQLQGSGEQVRVPLNAEQAEEMAAALLEHAAKVRAAKPSSLNLSNEPDSNGNPVMSSNIPKLLRVIGKELAPPRSWLPIFVGLVWSSRPLLHPETGWTWWPDLLYQSITAYLLYSLYQRVRRAWHAKTPGF